jgi:hypothetical protein
VSEIIEAKVKEVTSPTLKISSDGEYSAATLKLKEIARVRKEIDKTFDPNIDAAHKAHKQAIALKRKFTDVLDTTERVLRHRIGVYVHEIKQLGIADEDVMSVSLTPAAPKVEGVTTRESWNFKITDERLVPREFLAVDEDKIRRHVRNLKTFAVIPGVEVFKTETVVVRDK